ncbi:MAG: bifunctional glutamate N-acetyltransferase/amino-acid acetyltransferase ArgJ [Aggregatilineales bacterium]
MFEVKPFIQSVVGFQVASVAAGLKENGALDLALVVSDRPCAAAGVFTTNRVKAAPVLLDAERLARNPNGIRAVAINTRCANACTGERGLANAQTMASHTARALHVRDEDVLVLSTGVIGTHLPIDKIAAGIDRAVEGLGHDWDAAARAIMTTDTRPKLASTHFTTPDGSCSIAGIAKGAGMIAPNMATMLAVIVTDAALAPGQAQHALACACEETFNRIVVDGDMSTNDTVLLLANGASGVVIDDAEAERCFVEALTAVARQLAQAIVRDGEGVTKFITLKIGGASDAAAARQIGNTIATSPLVKTAFYGGDANWGRIIAAVGRSGVPIDPDALRLWIARGEEDSPELLLFEHGMPANYSEEAAAAIMAAPSITVHLECGMGEGSATLWTCDLSHDYVSINGHYRS